MSRRSHASSPPTGDIVAALGRRVQATQFEPMLKRPQRERCDSQEQYELAMGAYGIARDAKRGRHDSRSHRTKEENAERMRNAREETSMAAHAADGSEATAAARLERERARSQRRRDANQAAGAASDPPPPPPPPDPETARLDRLDRERERSQRRRDIAMAAADAECEAAALSTRCTEQVALLAAIDDALRRSDDILTQWDQARYFDPPLCIAIKEWAATHGAPDGSQAWEDELMAVAIAAATKRVSGAGGETAYRRIGALTTLRWLLPKLSFKETPGALSPDPEISVAMRAARGYCMCGCRLPPSHRLSDDDLRLGGPPSDEQSDRGNGAVPFCRVHGRRRAPMPYPARVAQRISAKCGAPPPLWF